MIYINRAFLFRAIAADGAGLTDPRTRTWWARRAIGAYALFTSIRITDPGRIARAIAEDIAPPAGTEEIWDALYAPQIAACRNAVAMARRRNLPLHEAVWFADERASRAIHRWLAALPEDDPRLLRKLDRIPWPQAVDHARRWHERVQRRHPVLAGSDGTTAILTIGPLTWHRLDTVAAIRAEGAAMHNCLADGHYDHVPGYRTRGEYDGLYSLRDATGASLATALLWRGNATQAHGPGNTRLSNTLASHVRTLIDTVQRRTGKTRTRRSSTNKTPDDDRNDGL
ncbi:hypothetical protein [Pelagibacterium halotolerans]|uniref:hypothetical protein n=1 Tax=Pelagibacterium halotolerans TaxID=531813 RepID=UPI00384C7A88